MTLAKQEPIEAYAVSKVYEDPRLTIRRQTDWAKALVEVVKQQGLSTNIQGKEYLNNEAWQIIGHFDKTYAKMGAKTPLEENGVVYAWDVSVDLISEGMVVGGASMICGLDSFPCRGKEGSDKHRAAISAAATWAASKAYRLKYGGVAKMAGFEPTPAEEMQPSTDGRPAQGGNPLNPNAGKTPFCELHKTEMFKKGGMRHFAHPVEGQTGPKGGKVWCEGAPAGAAPAKPVASLEAFIAECASRGYKANGDKKLSDILVMKFGEKIKPILAKGEFATVIKMLDDNAATLESPEAQKERAEQLAK